MELLKKTIPVTCAVIRQEDRILAVQRSRHDPMLPGLWEFPGGKVEPGETEEACLIREIREELELEVEILKRLPDVNWDYGNVLIRMTPFIVRIVTGTMKLNDHDAFRWMTVADLMSLDWAPADVPVVRGLMSEAGY
ncbi:MAG: NUDIX domain-containing protein [Bacteroidetes bacterium]|nr:NUDIX domain-containing protein [Bacteroidota bacterium]